MKKVLIDTHILIWWLSDPNKIKKVHLDIIADSDNLIFVSVSSLFEISLKQKIGKLEFTGDFEKILYENGFENLPITIKHIETLRRTSFPNKDPFDILIISQAITEDLELISYDMIFKDVDKLRVL